MGAQLQAWYGDASTARDHRIARRSRGLVDGRTGGVADCRAYGGRRGTVYSARHHADEPSATGSRTRPVSGGYSCVARTMGSVARCTNRAWHDCPRDTDVGASGAMSQPLAGRVACASFSGGKDSCLALWRARRAGLEVRTLINVLEESGQRNRSHGVPRGLLLAQADALGCNLLAPIASWADYETVFTATLRELRSQGTE